MLLIWGYAMVVAFMALIMTRRLSPLTALILVPIGVGALAGFGPGLGEMMVQGITKLAPTGVMLLFAILYFAVMIDAGLFAPFVSRLITLVHGDPVKVVMGSAALALLVSLDGDGSTTYMITTAAMLPLYRAMGIRPIVLACVTMLASGVMNILPWGGPTARAASALAVDVSDVFVPMVPVMVAGVAWTMYVAYRMGRAERGRLQTHGAVALQAEAVVGSLHDADADLSLRRPDRLWVNAMLTVVLLAALIFAVLPLPVLFMLAYAVAVMINYPAIEQQKALVSRHGGNVLAVVGLIFAAGVFTGILSGTKMVDAMANSVVTLVPPALGPYLAIVTGVLSVPFTFFISNDAFYYGVLPILAKAGETYGVTAAEMARASLVGQPVHLLSPLVPSTFLLVGLCGVDFGEHQRFTLRWALVSSLVLLLAGLLLLVIPLVGTR
ncbi:CitMHS family transporter [Gemmatimonas sp.]|uniref:CitMHS family transporter n=1 Tax=Gemmatimonas sp. TaxID=1962908 RepID=UPI0027BA6415|nr:citrate:proton symporter [Gemmatimonas sp.]